MTVEASLIVFPLYLDLVGMIFSLKQKTLTEGSGP